MKRFGEAKTPRIIVIGAGELNAMAVHFARRKIVVIFSELLEAIIENPHELEFLLAHELCHQSLDHGWRGWFELYKPAKYKQARELTCDNAGMVAAADLGAAQAVICKLCVGRILAPRLNNEALKEEARHIYSGFSGWLVRNYLSHPPAGARIENLELFAAGQSGQAAR